MIVKNCGTSVHLAIATSEFMKSISGHAVATRGDAATQRKSLALVRQWAKGFENVQSAFPVFAETYDALRSRVRALARGQGVRRLTGCAPRASCSRKWATTCP